MMFANRRAGDHRLVIYGCILGWRFTAGRLRCPNRDCVPFVLGDRLRRRHGRDVDRAWAFLSEVKAIIAEARLLADEGWIMSGTGNPVPDQDYLNSVESLYLSQDSAYSFQGLTTPEQFCPIVCNASEPDLGFGDSVNQGVGDLNSVIVPALQGGNDVAVLGYSQSATVATVEMNDLLNNTPPGVNLNDLSVTLLGDPNSPIGGILDRFQFPDGVGPIQLEP